MTLAHPPGPIQLCMYRLHYPRPIPSKLEIDYVLLATAQKEIRIWLSRIIRSWIQNSVSLWISGLGRFNLWKNVRSEISWDYPFQIIIFVLFCICCVDYVSENCHGCTHSQSCSTIKCLIFTSLLPAEHIICVQYSKIIRSAVKTEVHCWLSPRSQACGHWSKINIPDRVP
jgi:hypothetical protein